jgi:hypothetical protein
MAILYTKFPNSLLILFLQTRQRQGQRKQQLQFYGRLPEQSAEVRGPRRRLHGCRPTQGASHQPRQQVDRRDRVSEVILQICFIFTFK